MEKDINFKVRVSCFTFNHAPYIVDTMNGFAMQKTTFPFVCTIVDDASTDGEGDIIVHYIEEHFNIDDSHYRCEDTDDYRLVFAQHKKNENCFFAAILLKYNHYSIGKAKHPYYKEWSNTKYIAICEGDDLWIAPDKLQKQFEYMEHHDEIAMYTHAYRLVTKDNIPISEDHPPKKSGVLNAGEIIENKLFPQTASFFYRTALYKTMPAFFWQLDVSDYPLRVFCSISGGIYYEDMVMSSYRKYTPGSWTAKVKTDKALYSQHLEKIIIFTKKLDEYTKGKYHENCINRIDYCNYLKYINEGSYKMMIKTRYFKNLKGRKKIEAILQYKYPMIWYYFTKLYCRRK